MRRLTTAARASLLPLATLGTALAWLLPLAASASAPTTPVVSLRDMAESPVSLEAGDFALDRALQTATRTFAFSLPPGTVPPEPAARWFLVDLNYQIVFAPDSSPGFAWVSAATNGATAAQLEYELKRTDVLSVNESRVTLVDGQQERGIDGRIAEVTYTNYARDGGVRDGHNTFTLRVEHTEGVKIERIDFRDATGVSATETTPYPLGLSATVSATEIRVGNEFTVAVTLENRTGADLGDVQLEAVPADGIARQLDGPLHDVGQLDGTARYAFRFEALRSGTGQISVLGSSDRNMPSAVVDLVVLPRESSSARVFALIALATALPVAALFAIGFTRTRRRRRT